MKPVLVIGPPRSGTTWIGKTLGSTEGATYLHEPDALYRPYAVRAIRSMAPSPVLAADDRPARTYEHLWASAFGLAAAPRLLPARAVRSVRLRAERRLVAGTGTREVSRVARGHGGSKALRARIRLAGLMGTPRIPVRGRRPVVKSVVAKFALEWIAKRFDPLILIVLRHPLNVVASRVELGMDLENSLFRSEELRRRYTDRWGIEVPDRATPSQAVAWHVGLHTAALEEAARDNRWPLVVHEELLEDPITRFRSLAEGLGLVWSAEAERFVAEGNRPGHGYELTRVRSELADGWRKRLTPAQVNEACEILARFPILTWDLGALARRTAT